MAYSTPPGAPAGTSFTILIAVSGQMIAQDMHAVQRSGSKQTENGNPCLLN
jgi:hypothetical protein